MSILYDSNNSIFRMKTVLLLEDEKTIGKIYQKKLENAGYHVEWFLTAEEALQAARNAEVDVVMIDHGIRGHEVSGLDILPEMRKSLPQAKIIMLSNYSQSDMKEAALKAGADDYCIKIEMSPKILVEYIKNLFR